MTKLRHLNAAAFRGARFDLPLDFTKDHRSVAIYGENAAGKSTITDALEWFVNDKVEHLWRDDCKQEALRHAQCGDGDITQVKIAFQGQELSGTKSLSADLKTSVAYSNDACEQLVKNINEDNFYLRHAQITGFLAKTKGEKRKQIASIIGYDEIVQFRDVIQQTKNALQKEAAYTSAKARLDQLKSKSMELAGEQLTTKAGFYHKANALAGPMALKTAIADEKSYEDALKELRAKGSDPQKIKAAERLGQLEKSCNSFKDELEAVKSALAAFEAPNNELCKEKENVSKLRIGEFLAKGNQIIADGIYSDPNCPFCLSDYDLDQLQQEVGTRLAAMAALQQKFDSVKVLKDKLIEAITNAGRRAKSFGDDYADLDTFKKLITETGGGADTLRQLFKDINKSFEAFEPLPTSDTLNVKLDDLAALADSSAEQAQEEAGKLKLTEQEEAITKLIATLASLHELVGTYLRHDTTVKRYQAQFLTLEKIFDAFIKVQNEALQAVLDKISGDVGAFYAKLHPKENVDKVRLRMIGEEGVEFEYSFHGNPTQPPQKYLSESHLNSLGIVLFLANARIFNKKARFLVLDDIVTSFDTGHRRRLLRLLKEEFADWQIVLLTHESVWFDLIKRELRESGWLFKEVKADSDNGILLDESPATFRSLIEAKRGKLDVTNDLRKLLEATLKEICYALEVKVAFRFNDVNERRMADELTSQLRSTLKSKSPETAKHSVFSDLAGSTLIANLGSHDNPEPIVGEDIDVVLEDIDKLAALFICGKCNRPVRADANVPGEKKVSCSCGHCKIDWKD